MFDGWVGPFQPRHGAVDVGLLARPIAARPATSQIPHRMNSNVLTWGDPPVQKQPRADLSSQELPQCDGEGRWSGQATGRTRARGKRYAFGHRASRHVDTNADQPSRHTKTSLPTPDQPRPSRYRLLSTQEPGEPRCLHTGDWPALNRGLASRRPERPIGVLPDVGPVLGAILVARSVKCNGSPPPRAGQLGRAVSKALRIRPRVHRGRITEQGSRLVRWADVEAVQRADS